MSDTYSKFRNEVMAGGTDKPDADATAGGPTAVIGLAVILGLLALLFVSSRWAFLFVVGLLISVFLHELGHFVTARWTGMKATQFFLFMGPKLWSFRRGETEYGLRAYPVGAFVRIIGMNNLDEVEPQDEARAYRNKSYPRRLLVITAGSLMHIAHRHCPDLRRLFRERQARRDRPGRHRRGHDQQPRRSSRESSPATTVVSIDGVAPTSADQFVDAIHNHQPGDSAVLVLERDGRRVETTVTLGSNPSVGEDFGKAYLGIASGNEVAWNNESVVRAAKDSILDLGPGDVAQCRRCGEGAQPGQHLRPPQWQQRRPRHRPTTVVGISKLSGTIGAESGLGGLLLTLAAVNVFVGLLNMFPVLPFDGGHAAIATYERLRSRRGRPPYRADISKMIPGGDDDDRGAGDAVHHRPLPRFRQAAALSWHTAGMPFDRRATRQIAVGKVLVGGGAPISVQSMTITKTADVEGTLQQIYALAAAGCDIVRCTCNEQEAAEGLAQIVPRSPIPIIADIHHQYRMALAAMEAGVHGLRLNPGNIRRPEHIKAVAVEARDRQISIRIGVNGGSLDPSLYDKYGGITPEAMVESAEREMAYFREVDFDLMKISVKSSNVPLMIEAYRQLSETTDVPLHLGVTEAGPPPAGLVKATAGIATLLMEGIGDTIRYSLTADPVEEARAGRQLLEALGLRERKNIDLIACPSCGRAEIDVIDVANRAMQAFGDRKIPLQVAVMGCVVNGPGEAREADLGIAAGNKRGHLFVKGRNVAVVPESDMVEALVEWAEFINEHGTEAAIARVDTALAEREAAKDRAKLIDDKGADANHDAERIVEIRRTATR